MHSFVTTLYKSWRERSLPTAGSARRYALLFWLGLTSVLACSKGDALSFGPSENDDRFGEEDRDNTPSVPCQIKDPRTRIIGTVYDPKGRLPIYNAIVYVPTEPVKPLVDGATCNQCGTPVSGAPAAVTLTGPDGRFVLSNVPAGENIPLVIQIGKWRRQITIPSVAACSDTAMDDPEVMRLPRNRSEGDIPSIALVTGMADRFQCMFLNMGLDPAELTNPDGPGHVHFYAGVGGEVIDANTPPATTLWSDLERMNKYDVIINACEGAVHPDTKPQTSLDNSVAYTATGGRLFLTHYHYYWIDPRKDSPTVKSPWSSAATLNPAISVASGDVKAYLDTSFPKGGALADWLKIAEPRSDRTLVDVFDARYDFLAVKPPTTRWLYAFNENDGLTAPLHYTFNTPREASAENQCGKVLFSDFHVVATDEACVTDNPRPQQKILQFMLFDLFSCVQSDAIPPILPR